MNIRAWHSEKNMVFVDVGTAITMICTLRASSARFARLLYKKTALRRICK
jgi:hypothetical protein